MSASLDVAGRLTTPAGRVYQTAGVVRTGRPGETLGERVMSTAEVRWWEPVALPVVHQGDPETVARYSDPEGRREHF